jgi:sugar phosphate isomerase/epimerase
MIRLGICNELFEAWDLPGVCRVVSGLGYAGLELAPFTLATSIRELSAARRREVRSIIEDAGLQTIGLHWLLARTEGLHLTSPNPKVRQATGEYLVDLAEATSDLGGTLMVFGSPKQRSLLPGVTLEQANKYAVEVLSRIMPVIGAVGVDLCLEPLGPDDTDFINTCAQALALIRRVDHPHLKLHLDVKAQCSEKGATVPELIRQYAPEAGHFHAQDVNLRGPGMGLIDFRPIMGALVAANYDRWVSVEVFDFSPGAETTARLSIGCLREALAAASASGEA